MCRKLMYVTCMSMVLALASTALADSVLVSSFETDLGGWYTDTWTAGTISLSATGATVGTQAMQVQAPGGWKECTKVNMKPHMAALSTKGVKIMADVTAFAADMTTTWMQVGMLINSTAGVGRIDLGLQDLPRDGQPHTLKWFLPDDATTKIAGADASIGWFEIALISNVDGASVAKFYIDNIRIEERGGYVSVSSFETGLEGWYTDQWTAGTVSLSATGATAGAQAMQVQAPGGWKQCTKVDMKPHMAALATKGVKITADVTAFAADMTTTWMQVGMVINSTAGVGWIDLDLQGLARDGRPHRFEWVLSDDTTSKIAGADASIGWFELLLISNVDGASVAKFYIDNILITSLPVVAGKSTDVVIANWEQDMDGWVAGGNADVLFNDHNGVTLGDYSLDVYLENGGGWQDSILQLNVVEANLVDEFKANTKISVDITRLVADWPTDAIPQWNEITLVIQGGDGWNPDWIQLPVQAGWDRNDGDQTVTATWDYGARLAQMNNLDGVSWMTLRVVSNVNSSYAGWSLFYLDNMKLTGGGIPLHPQPARGAIDVDADTLLSWTGGGFASSHNLYLGTSRGAVAAAEGEGSPDVVFAAVDGTSFDPNGLRFNTQYFWRVDAVNDVNPDSPWKGDVWSFTTANFIIVDDFESYTDNFDAGEAVFNTWRDGWWDPAYGGSQVGYGDAPYCEPTTVHGGGQSMPFSYDATDAAFSEAVRTWAEPQDWTRNGYDTLKIYVYGRGTNNADELYVRIEDSAGKAATVKYPNAAIFTTEAWTEWLIRTNEFTDVNMAAVTTLVIGVGKPNNTTKAKGTLLIDDIQVGVRPLGLVAHYALESNLQDSSGNGFHGTLAGDPNFPVQYVNGPTGFGKGLLFEGTGGHQNVELGTFNPSAATGRLTVALWAKWDGPSDQWQGLIGKRDGWAQNNMMWHIELNRDSGTIGFASYTGGCWPNVPLPIGQWTHVAVTHDGTAARFYIDGTQVATGSFLFSEKTGSAMHFGSDDPDGGNAFNGALDEVRIYDRILSEAEVKALMTP